MTGSPTYCLDSNILIQAWNSYYSPELCPEYWDTLNKLGDTGEIFIPQEVRDEIISTDDDLASWVKSCTIDVRQTSVDVINCWKKIQATNEVHKHLVAESTGRSLADPWVISHAMDAGAVVVTKELFVPNPRATRIKIPNVCKNMDIECINDFELLKRLGIRFFCRIDANYDA